MHTLVDLPTLKLKNYKGWDGIVISHGTSKRHKASTVTWQRPSKAELHDVCHATFGFDFHILYAWETFNICTIGDIGMMEIFLSLNFAFPQEHCFPQENPGHATSSSFSDIFIYLKVFPIPWKLWWTFRSQRSLYGGLRYYNIYPCPCSGTR